MNCYGISMAKCSNSDERNPRYQFVLFPTLIVVMPRMYVNDMELGQVSLYRQLRVLKGLWILHRRGFQKITERRPVPVVSFGTICTKNKISVCGSEKTGDEDTPNS